MVNIRKLYLALLSGLLIAIAVVGGVIYAGGTMEERADQLNGTRWNLASINGNPAIEGRNPAGLAFAEGKVTGSTGCNRMFGSYSLTNGQLALSGLGSTRMACTPELNQQEQHFLQALGAIESYTIADDQLTLLYDGGKELVFTKA
jgi:heat shock protein HslJ